MAIVFVTNTSTTQKGTLRANDGDSIEILAAAQDIPVDSKFLWRMPRHITQNAAPVISLNQPVEEESNMKEALERVKMRRMGKAPTNIHRTAVINRHTAPQGEPVKPVDETQKTNVLGESDDHVLGVGRNPKLSTGGPAVR